jgi:enterochelin esterase family protein
MQRFLLRLLCIFSLIPAALAQSQRVVSPEVHSDGKVTFRIRSPEAKEVLVHCEGVKETKMQKDDQGVWSLTSEPLEPDYYSYSFTIAGCRALDLHNPLLKYNLLNTDSQLHVAGPTTLLWEVNDVPHGLVHHHFYRSAVAQDDRDFYVYTPPNYNPSARQRYPVLYLLHGYSDDASAWVDVGCANVILDNLIARHLAKPMLVVMPLGYGTMDIVKAGWGGLRGRDLWQRNSDQFRENLLREVLPQVEKAYRVLPGQKNRAIAGLSMGGAESLTIGLNSLDRFAYIGAFSSGGLSENFSALFPGLNDKTTAQLRLLWIGCGKEDGLMGANQKLSDWLKASSVRHTWVATPGQHSFRVWRRYLGDFLPLLFQEKK